jgi:hypothetical protein
MSPGADAYSWFVACAQVDAAVHAERDNALSGLRVDLLEHVVRAEDQAPVGAVAALPVVHAATVESLRTLVAPDRLSGRRVERYERPVRAATVDHTARDDGIEVGRASLVRPRHFELLNVGSRDLGRRDEPGAVGTAAVITPFTWLLAGDRRACDRGQHQHQCDLEDIHSWTLCLGHAGASPVLRTTDGGR